MKNQIGNKKTANKLWLHKIYLLNEIVVDRMNVISKVTKIENEITPERVRIKSKIKQFKLNIDEKSNQQLIFLFPSYISWWNKVLVFKKSHIFYMFQLVWANNQLVILNESE